MARSPKPVRQLLKDKPSLKILELEVSAQKALLADVRRLLPETIRTHNRFTGRPQAAATG